MARRPIELLIDLFGDRRVGWGCFCVFGGDRRGRDGLHAFFPPSRRARWFSSKRCTGRLLRPHVGQLGLHVLAAQLEQWQDRPALGCTAIGISSGWRRFLCRDVDPRSVDWPATTNRPNKPDLHAHRPETAPARAPAARTRCAAIAQGAFACLRRSPSCRRRTSSAGFDLAVRTNRLSDSTPLLRAAATTVATMP